LYAFMFGHAGIAAIFLTINQRARAFQLDA
jgi:hypothetical protein